MFLNPFFLIPALVIIFFQAMFLTCFYYSLKGKIAVPAEGPESFLWKLEYEHKVARILFPLALVIF